MNNKNWSFVTTVIILIEIWLFYTGYILMGKPPADDGYYGMVGATVTMTSIGLFCMAASDDDGKKAEKE